jgi:hypothetical protein
MGLGAILATVVHVRRFRISCYLGSRVCQLCLVAVFLSFAAGCNNSALHRVDTSSLDQAGMSYDSIQQLKQLSVTDAEVAEIAKAKQGGFSDDTCLALVRVARNQGHPFNEADAAVSLLQVGMSESDILEIARLKQMGLEAGELQAIRLTGAPDAIVLEVARKHAAGVPILSGPSIARMMNTTMSRQTILELIRRDVPDSQAQSIISMKRHHITDAEILRRYPGAAASAKN